MIECNIDDMNSEFYEHIMKKLFDLGALDVFLTNIIMKKGRPAIKLSVLTEIGSIDKISNFIFSETSTIGIRYYPVSREVLDRNIIKVHTKYGPCKVKVAYRNKTAINYAPEYEDIKVLAQNNGIPIKEIYNEVIRNIDI